MADERLGTIMVCEDGCCVALLNDAGNWQAMDREQPGRTWEYSCDDLIGEWRVIYVPGDSWLDSERMDNEQSEKRQAAAEGVSP